MYHIPGMENRGIYLMHKQAIERTEYTKHFVFQQKCQFIFFYISVSEYYRLPLCPFVSLSDSLKELKKKTTPKSKQLNFKGFIKGLSHH